MKHDNNFNLAGHRRKAYWGVRHRRLIRGQGVVDGAIDADLRSDTTKQLRHKCVVCNPSININREAQQGWLDKKKNS